MKHESGLDPTITNSIGCVGLIQFCPGGGSIKIVNGVPHYLEDLRNDLGLQMDAIRDFWVRGYNNGKIKSPEDLYIYNFFPGQQENLTILYYKVVGYLQKELRTQILYLIEF